MSPRAWEALICMPETSACFQRGKTISHSLFPCPRAFNSRERTFLSSLPYRPSAQQYKFWVQKSNHPKGMWDLLSAQFFLKTARFSRNGLNRKWELLSRAVCIAQPTSFKYEIHICHQILKFLIPYLTLLLGALKGRKHLGTWFLSLVPAQTQSYIQLGHTKFLSWMLRDSQRFTGRAGSAWKEGGQSHAHDRLQSTHLKSSDTAPFSSGQPSCQ